MTRLQQLSLFNKKGVPARSEFGSLVFVGESEEAESISSPVLANPEVEEFRPRLR